MNISDYVSKFINGTNQSLFLTGKAGTGKTTLLKEIVETTHKKTVIAAPTGIAAINAGGVTLHSLFHLPFGSFIPDQEIPQVENLSFQVTNPKMLLRNLKMNSQKKALIREMELLIIDEVSMLRADLLDAIDTILRYVRRDNKVFGGLQILFIGDLWQLPPVVKNEEWNVLKSYYSNIFFFNATTLKKTELVYLELDKIFRQTDSKFIELLNHFRLNTINQSDIDLLNQCYKKQFNLLDNEGYIYLTTHNHKADKINKEALDQLPGKTYRFEADLDGEFSEYSFPVDPVLELKEGAQAMFIKNDYSGNQAYFNGKIGKIDAVSEDHIVVSFPDGSEPAEVERYTWENKKFALNQETREVEERIVGTYSHFPLKLAWAITIHKSQGLTFEKAVIDISQAFAAGQTYVALSRLTSLEGLVLASPVHWSGPEIDNDLAAFAKSKITEERANEKYRIASKQYINQQVSDAFNFSELIQNLNEHIATYNKDSVKSAKQKHLTWALNLKKDLEEIIKVSGKFQNQLKSIMLSDSENHLVKLKSRVIAAKDYFIPLLKEKQDLIESHMQVVQKEKGIKKYLKELMFLQGLFYGQIILIHKAEALCIAVLNNEEINKETFNTFTESIKKPEEDKSAKKEKKKKEKGKPKIKTTEVTYDLYRKGYSVQNIAKERSLSVITIEKHLSDCIEQGKIDISELMDSKRIKEILRAIETEDTSLLKPVKEYLGDNYSYAEIKYVMSWLKFERVVGK
ncbi:MAG: helix-turn-helix domain-containing protein [Bacteroidetes bacterium]|nr:helix-turn-helix domain-containing protein [Bacteroidota bacterium]